MHQPVIGNWTLADLLRLAAIGLAVVFALGILGGFVYFLTPGAYCVRRSSFREGLA